MIKNLTLLLCFQLLSLFLTAQELGLHFMNNAIQQNQTNPAFFTDKKFVLSLPNAYAGFANSVGSVNDLLLEQDNGNYKIDKHNLMSRLGEDNMLRTELSLSAIGFGIGGKRWRASVGHQIRFNSLVRFPKALAELALDGNAKFIDETVNLAPELMLDVYSEIGVGFSYQLAKLTVGGRLKYLNGLANVLTEKKVVSVYTDPEFYALTVNTDYLVNTSASHEYGGMKNFDLDALEFKAGDIFGNNSGFAVDIGAQYEVNERLKVAASLVDLGMIKWKDHVYNNESKGEFTYDGIDVSTALDGDSLSYDNLMDSLTNTFDFVETQNAYRSSLPLKLYLSGQYQLNKWFRAGGLFLLENMNGKNLPAVALSGTAELGSICALGLVVSKSTLSKTSLGLNMNLNLGPIQLIALTDNILGLVNPLNNKSFNTRFGLNIAIQ